MNTKPNIWKSKSSSWFDILSI